MNDDLTTLTPSVAGTLTASALADMLTSILRKPVLDRTGLTGDYQIPLDISTSTVPDTRGVH